MRKVVWTGGRKRERREVGKRERKEGRERESEAISAPGCDKNTH